jgi:HSP20 family molecular chaperone IbpA
MAATLARWRDNVFAPFEAGSALFPFVAPEIRVEQLVEDGQFVVRAEIPGVDPEKDVDVSIVNGVLSIRAERTEEKRDKTHSEFHYGRLVRTVPLPAGAQEDSATATYSNGILEVAFTLGEPQEPGRHVPIEVGGKAEEKSSGKATGSKAKK